jgi:pyridoxine/pyridoxamine 5'-phosphate oxidase
MDELGREALRLTWDLAQRQHRMLAEIIPVIREIVDVFLAEQQPTDEQLHKWHSLHSRLVGDMTELHAAFESILQLFQHRNFDA